MKIKGALVELLVICYGYYQLKALKPLAFAFLAGANIAYDLFIFFSFLILKKNSITKKD
jgi:hypothetical protein